MNSVRHGRPLVQQRGLHRTALHERVPCASRLHASRLDAGCHLSANRQRAIRLCAMRLPANRRGLTLLEIILALAIFFGSLAALAQLSWNGSRAAVQARLKTQAIIRCEAKLAEILAGAQRLQSSSRVPFPDNAAWTWSLSITETNYPLTSCSVSCGARRWSALDQSLRSRNNLHPLPGSSSKIGCTKPLTTIRLCSACCRTAKPRGSPAQRFVTQRAQVAAIPLGWIAYRIGCGCSWLRRGSQSLPVTPNSCGKPILPTAPFICPSSRVQLSMMIPWMLQAASCASATTPRSRVTWRILTR